MIDEHFTILHTKTVLEMHVAPQSFCVGTRGDIRGGTKSGTRHGTRAGTRGCNKGGTWFGAQVVSK